MSNQLRQVQKPSLPVPEEAPLDSGVASSLLLATERVTSARTLTSLRELELQVLVDKVRSHFEEGGAYVVHEVDPARGVVRRTPRPRPPESVTTNGSAEGHGA